MMQVRSAHRPYYIFKEPVTFADGHGSDGKVKFRIFPIGTKVWWTKPNEEELKVVKRYYEIHNRKYVTVILEGVRRLVPRDLMMSDEEVAANRRQLVADGVLPEEP